MGEVQLPLPGKIFCILCNGVVSFKNGDRSRFIGHMNHEHEAFLGVSFMLAGCLMSQEERTAVETIMEEKYNSGKIEVNRIEDETIAIEEDVVVAEDKLNLDGYKELAESVVTVIDEKPCSSSKVDQEINDRTDKNDGKVKISMRNFLLENKNIQSTKETKSSMYPEQYMEVGKDDAKNSADHQTPSDRLTAEVVPSLFKCDLCTVSFKVSSSLRRHKSKQHGEKLSTEVESKENNVPTSNNVATSITENVDLPDKEPKGLNLKTLHQNNSLRVTKLSSPVSDITTSKNESQIDLTTSSNPSVVSAPKYSVKSVEASDECMAKKIVTSMASEESSHVCNICGNVFKSEPLLILHVKESHDGKKTTEKKPIIVKNSKNPESAEIEALHCDKCNKKFMMERNLNFHRKVAHGQTSNKKKVLPKLSKFNYTCAPCNIKFETEDHLRKHERANHKNVKNAENKVKLEQISISKVHNSTHTNENPTPPLDFINVDIKKEPNELMQLPCGKCPITFVNPMALKRHTLKRHGYSKHRCTKCKKKFKTSSEFTLHMKNEHGKSGVTFPCDQCDVVCQHQQSLSRHKMKIHGRKDANENRNEDTNINTGLVDMKSRNTNDGDETDTAGTSKKKSNDTSFNDKANFNHNFTESLNLEESVAVIDLSTSQYFNSHPSMIKPLTKKLHQKLLDEKMIVEDNHLPAGWFIKNTLRKGKLANKEFITPDRKVIRSVDGMREYMRLSNNYSRAEIQNTSKYFRKRMTILE